MLQKYHQLAVVTSISQDNVKSNDQLVLAEVIPGIVEVSVGICEYLRSLTSA